MRKDGQGEQTKYQACERPLPGGEQLEALGWGMGKGSVACGSLKPAIISQFKNGCLLGRHLKKRASQRDPLKQFKRRQMSMK